MIQAGSSVYKAAKVLGLPESTIRDRVKRPELWGAKHGGHNQVMTPAEERKIVEWALKMCQRGVPVYMAHVCEEVEYVLKGDTRITPFTGGKPGRRWCEGFLKRNPEVRLRIAQLATAGRLQITPACLREWFDASLAYFLTEPSILEAVNDPARTWNMDESGFTLEGRSGRVKKVLVASGSRQNYALKAGGRTMITTIACFNAAGDYMPPFFIYPGLNLAGIDPSGFPEAFNWVQPSGWADGPAFLQFIKAFDAYLERADVKRPVILWLDNHISHRYIPALVFAQEKGIHVYAFLANATHILQPCDVGLFSALKVAFTTEAQRFLRFHYGEVLTKYHFSSIMRKAWEVATKPETAVHAFRRTGIYPFNYNNVDQERLKDFARPAGMLQIFASDCLKTIACTHQLICSFNVQNLQLCQSSLDSSLCLRSSSQHSQPW